MPMTAPALELRGLSKSFGALQAIRDVSLAIPAGSIAGIVGENGAGKSTLMNLVYGLLTADRGEILVDGREAGIASPRDAIALKIGMVHQHFMLVDTFTVAENVVLGAEAGPILATSLAAARRELDRLREAYGLAIDPDALVGDLAVGDQQRVEILKVLYRGARLLILDEPTAVLTPQETEGLFRILRELAASGVTIILVTHKLREIMAVTSRVFVMRMGALVAERETRATSPKDIAELMVGGSPPSRPASPGPEGRAESAKPTGVGTARPHIPTPVHASRDSALPSGPGEAGREGGAPLLHTTSLTLLDPRTKVPLLTDIHLALRPGEIVGVAGVSGNGQSELLEILSGMRAPSSGTLRIGGREVTAERSADPAEMRRLGIAHVPEHRHRHGIVDAFPAYETAILGRHRPSGARALIDWRAVRRRCGELMVGADVRPPHPDHLTGRFSGGNQQKLVMAREIEAAPRIMLVGQPTRGVDIGAIAQIHARLRALRDEGCAILLVSAELDELMALADRIVVMCAGAIVGEVAGGTADPREIGLLMSGGHDPVNASAA